MKKKITGYVFTYRSLSCEDQTHIYVPGYFKIYKGSNGLNVDTRADILEVEHCHLTGKGRYADPDGCVTKKNRFRINLTDARRIRNAALAYDRAGDKLQKETGLLEKRLNGW